MSVKISISIIYLIILLANTIFITSCINYFSENYECYHNVTYDDGLIVTSSTINVFFWIFIASEFIITLSIGTLIGLNVAQKFNTSSIKFSSYLIILVNVLKLLLIIIFIVLYINCISELPAIKIYLFVFFGIDIILAGLTECLISCLLIYDEQEIKTITLPIDFFKNQQRIMYTPIEFDDIKQKKKHKSKILKNQVDDEYSDSATDDDIDHKNYLATHLLKKKINTNKKNTNINQYSQVPTILTDSTQTLNSMQEITANANENENEK